MGKEAQSMTSRLEVPADGPIESCRNDDRCMSSICIALVAVTVSLLSSNINSAIADVFGTGENTFDIEFVTIGSPNNLPDTTGPTNPVGSVDYVYDIGKHEISRDNVTKANAEGALGITLDAMAAVTGGPRGDMPATGISWNEAARFVNWLNMSQGFQPAYKFSTQPGDVEYSANAGISLWLPTDPGYDSTNLFRNSLAKFILPSRDEWYKAAYFDPDENNGEGRYWNFATGTDTQPIPISSGTDPGTSVYMQPLDQGPATVTQAGGLSPFGTMGQDGNVFEFVETLWGPHQDGPLIREVRGGYWPLSNRIGVLGRDDFTPDFSDGGNGLRVASIPEPSSLVLLSLGAVILLHHRRGRAMANVSSLCAETPYM